MLHPAADHSVFFAEYESNAGFQLHADSLPEWFKHFVLGE